MNRFKYAEEKPICKLCHEEEAVKHKMCDYCYRMYLTYYNYIYSKSRGRTVPMSPDQYIKEKLEQQNEQI